MSLSDEERARFDRVFDEIFTPIVKETKEDIDRILAKDPELKKQIEEQVEKIMQMRKNKKTTDD